MFFYLGYYGIGICFEGYVDFDFLLLFVDDLVDDFIDFNVGECEGECCEDGEDFFLEVMLLV